MSPTERSKINVSLFPFISRIQSLGRLPKDFRMGTMQGVLSWSEDTCCTSFPSKLNGILEKWNANYGNSVPKLCGLGGSRVDVNWGQNMHCSNEKKSSSWKWDAKPIQLLWVSRLVSFLPLLRCSVKRPALSSPCLYHKRLVQSTGFIAMRLPTGFSPWLGLLESFLHPAMRELTCKTEKHTMQCPCWKPFRGFLCFSGRDQHFKENFMASMI